jgi:hypothetical protein
MVERAAGNNRTMWNWVATSNDDSFASMEQEEEEDEEEYAALVDEEKRLDSWLERYERQNRSWRGLSYVTDQDLSELSHGDSTLLAVPTCRNSTLSQQQDQTNNSFSFTLKVSPTWLYSAQARLLESPIGAPSQPFGSSDKENEGTPHSLRLPAGHEDIRDYAPLQQLLSVIPSPEKKSNKSRKRGKFKNAAVSATVTPTLESENASPSLDPFEALAEAAASRCL